METLHYRLPRRIRTDAGRQKCTPVAAAALGKNMNQVIGGRGLPDTLKYSHNECACIRCKVIVFCRSCGYFVNGRIRRQCPIHPRVRRKNSKYNVMYSRILMLYVKSCSSISLLLYGTYSFHDNALRFRA